MYAFYCFFQFQRFCIEMSICTFKALRYLQGVFTDILATPIRGNMSVKKIPLKRNLKWHSKSLAGKTSQSRKLGWDCSCLYIDAKLSYTFYTFFTTGILYSEAKYSYPPSYSTNRETVGISKKRKRKWKSRESPKPIKKTSEKTRQGRTSGRLLLL